VNGIGMHWQRRTDLH